MGSPCPYSRSSELHPSPWDRESGAVPVPLCRQILRPPCPLGPQWLPVSMWASFLDPPLGGGSSLQHAHPRPDGWSTGSCVAEGQSLWCRPGCPREREVGKPQVGGCPLIPATQARVGLISGFALQWVLQAHPSSTPWP